MRRFLTIRITPVFAISIALVLLTFSDSLSQARSPQSERSPRGTVGTRPDTTDRTMRGGTREDQVRPISPGQADRRTERTTTERSESRRPERTDTERSVVPQSHQPPQTVDRDRSERPAARPGNTEGATANTRPTVHERPVRNQQPSPPPASVGTAPVPVIPSPRPVYLPAIPPPARRSAWSPRYVYRQVYYIESGRGIFRRSRPVEVRTEIRQRLRNVSHGRRVVDLRIERISLYDRGLFVGEITHIPGRFSDIRATVHRDGRIDVDRMTYLIGDPGSGFALVSSRYYDDLFYNSYSRNDSYRVAELDFRSRRARQVRQSPLFDPFRYANHVPVPLLSPHDDWYFVYGYYDTGGTYHYNFNDTPYAHYSQIPIAPRSETTGRPPLPQQSTTAARGTIGMGPSRSSSPATHENDPVFRMNREQMFRTGEGTDIRVRREVQIRRVED